MGIGFLTPEIDDLGLAGYLRIMSSTDRPGYDGVLFVVNGVGEPVEFCFSSIETPRTVLWGRAALRRRANSELTKALLTACSSTPVLLLAKAEEVGPETFSDDIVTSVPTCRLTTRLEAIAVGVSDQEETVDESSEVQVVWSGEAPGMDSPARKLLSKLSEIGLLVEPFERAVAGLAEVRQGE